MNENTVIKKENDVKSTYDLTSDLYSYRSTLV